MVVFVVVVVATVVFVVVVIVMEEWGMHALSLPDKLASSAGLPTALKLHQEESLRAALHFRGEFRKHIFNMPFTSDALSHHSKSSSENPIPMPINLHRSSEFFHGATPDSNPRFSRRPR